MKKSIIIIVLLLLLAPPFVISQEAPHKLVQFQMAILKKGPKWDSTKLEERNQILHQHLRDIVAMLNSGKMVLAGPFADDTDTAGIFILRASSTDEAKTWVDADPAVKAGLITPEMHPWFSEDIFKKASTPLQFEDLYFVFLKKGANRKEGDDKTSGIQELQKAHIANINRLAAEKKLVAAGPFGDDWDARGIFILRVGSLKEAQDLCASDPMVKIDRLRVEVHPWSAPQGILP